MLVVLSGCMTHCSSVIAGLLMLCISAADALLVESIGTLWPMQCRFWHLLANLLGVLLKQLLQARQGIFSHTLVVMRYLT